MKIPYFCCIGAELKRYAKDFDFMNQVYLYKVPTDDSIEEVLAEDYFKAISDSVLQDDILYIYEASAETLHSCRFDKQNGHITAIPLASDETLTGAVTTIIHDNLTKNRAVISNNDGKIAVSEVTSTELGYLHGATSNIQEQLNEKAKTDLSNLTSAGKNIANWSSNVTNCITEIPQDINLELNNGTLTLKAGSKVYVPNGAGVFNQITIANDKVLIQNWNNTDSVFIAWYDNNLTLRKITDVCSGATDTISGRFHWWYDTTNNIIKEIESDGTARTNKVCLPIAVITMVGDGTAHVSSINLIFGGFGYIGNSVFALPGLSGLVPNGRNADGTLKNTAWTTTQVIVRTFTNGGNYSLFFDGNVFARTSGYEYKEQENLNWDTVGNQIFTVTYLCLIQMNGTGRITYMGNRNVFHSVDYDDSNWAAHQAMPSNRYIDMTLGASGTSYTAPADGYFYLRKKATAVGQYIYITDDIMSLDYVFPAANTKSMIYHCRKGAPIRITYTTDGTTERFRFVYAQGAK